MKNRFLTIEETLTGPANRFVPKPARKWVATAQSKKAKCTQFSEIDIEADPFVLDVLQFFFDERLEAEQLNDDLRDIAARALWRATEGSEAMDMVPRPPGGRPGVVWLISQAVQIGFRRAQNRCIYEAVRRTIKLSMRSEYEIAQQIAVSQSMQAPVTTSDRGVAMIQDFEGFRAQLYDDAAGHCTIGYGHLVHRGRCDGTEAAEFRAGISEKRAEELLRERLRGFEDTVNAGVQVSLTQCQFDALVSFCFNIGSGAFQRSTLLRKLNQGQFGDVPSELERWVNGDGRVLPGLVRRRKAEAALFADCVYPGLSAAQGTWSRSLFDTGEHVLAGEDLPDLEGHEKYVETYLTGLTLEVGQPNSAGARVPFTYGELITLGDLFEDYGQMEAASHRELTRLQQLIRQSRKHYEKKIIANASRLPPGVSNEEWQKATADRYLELALDNFAHFAPSDPSIVTAVGDDRNHRTMWMHYHGMALDTVRESPTDDGWRAALAINAFGDHFLTDAFSAGHLFNKADVAARFNAQLTNADGSLTTAGKAFFDKAAAAAFTGKLKEAFSEHETVEKKGLRFWGYIWFPHHANIHNKDRFSLFLQEVHKAQPDAIAYGLVAKVIHDLLNQHSGGIPVENGLGEAWNLRGDATLDLRNLRMMRRAVSRSIYNVVIEATATQNNSYLYDQVWQYVPVPTQQSQRLISDLIRTYTQPDHPKLIQAAADVLSKEFTTLLTEAVKRGKLKPA